MSLFVLVCIFVRHKNKELIVLTAINVILYLLPIGNALTVGFSSTKQRGTFALILLIAFETTELLKYLKDIQLKECIIFFITTILLVVALYRYGTTDAQRLAEKIIILELVIWGVVFALRLKFSKLLIVQYIVSIVIVFAGALTNFVVMYHPDYYNSIAGLKERSDIEQIEKSVILAADLDGNATYRYSAENTANYNIASAFGYPNVQTYASITPSSVYDFMFAMENRTMTTPYAIFGVDNRGPLLELLSVRYLNIPNEENARIPFGYSLVGNNNGYSIYENQYSIPIGFTYQSIVDKVGFEKLNAVEKQSAMLHAIYIPKQEKSLQSSVVDVSELGDVEELSYQITGQNGVAWENGVLTVSNEDAWMDITCTVPSNSEIYLRLENFYYDQGNCNIAIGLSDTQDIRFWIKSGLDSYYYGLKNYTAFLMQNDNEVHKKTWRIKFKNKGTFECSDISLFSESNISYRNAVELLQENSMSDIKIASNCVEGKINSDGNDILFLSLPYQKGWSVFVDGEKQKIYQANYFGMAVSIAEGEHFIKCTYETPGLKLGAFISFLGFALFCFSVVYDNKKIMKK